MLPGTAAWVSFFQHAIPFLRTIAERVRSNYTLPFLIGRVSESVFSAAWAVMAVEIATTIALSGFAWWCCSRLSWSKAAVNKDSAFCLLLVTSLLASAIAWAHYFVFMIYPLLRLAAEAGPARGRQRAWLVALVVASLAAFNLADAEPGSMSLRCLSVAANKAPVFVLGLLYLRFARQTSSDTLVKCGHEPRRASASNPSLSE